MQIKSAAFLAGAVALAPLAAADDTVAQISRPDFTPTSLNAPFLEQFTDDWESRWKVSQAKRVNDGSTDEEWAYVGKWAVEEPSVYQGINGDKGLVLKDKAAHHAISAKFPSAVDPKGKDLVVQYEVKLQDGLECGGAYLKLLQENSALHSEEFSNAAPYVIMFGPDKCGSTNKVHFIFKHKNPVTGEYEEKHMSQNVPMNNTKQSTLYGLHVKPDNSFTVSVNGEDKATGSLLEDFTPDVNPAKEIDDPDDTKPSDWVDAAKIADPEATKPEDWDEDAPFQIVDESAEKPEDWLEDEPAMIPDPEAEKPEDWDDEEDGDWVAPMVTNPKCIEAAGCGPWEKPMIKNPEYKGKWKAPMIDNPEYKGVWKPRLISNPGYFEDTTPANFEPIGGIGFEIWTMQGNILFDNIYVGHSAADAAKLKAETFDVKKPIEETEENSTKPKVDDSAASPDGVKSPLDLKFSDDPVLFIREKVELFITLARRDPLEAIKFVPEVAGGIAVGIVGVLFLLFGGLGAAATTPQAKQAANKAKAAASDAQAKATDLKNQAVDSVSSSADTARAEVNKRTTRSSAAAENVGT